MRGIRGEPYFDEIAFLGFDHLFVSQVILHIAVARNGVGDVVVAEFLEYEFVRFLKRVREDVEPAAVSHAHDDFLDAHSSAMFEGIVQTGNKGLSAFQGKALLARVARMEEALEGLCGIDLAQNSLLDFVRKLNLALQRFDLLLDPPTGIGVLHVHVFVADIAAIGLFERRDELAQTHLPTVEKVPRIEFLLEIALA